MQGVTGVKEKEQTLVKRSEERGGFKKTRWRLMLHLHVNVVSSSEGGNQMGFARKGFFFTKEETVASRYLYNKNVRSS